jgi:tetratricopeptide (TPR) repeat protein
MENQYEPLCNDQQGLACHAIQVDFDNIRTAWYWAVSQQQFEWLQGSIRIVSYFSDLRGHFHEGLAMFKAAQTAIESSDHPQKQLLAGKIKMRAGILNFRLSRYDTALALFNEIRQIPGLDFEQFYVLRYLGDYHFSFSGFFPAEQSKKFLDECIEQSDRFGIPHTRIECLIQLAFLYTNQIVDIELSHQYASQAVELARENSSPDVLAYALDVYAWTINHRGDYAEAEAIWLEALEIATRAGNRRDIALVTNWLGWSTWSVGEARLEEAAELFTDGLNRYRDLGDRANVSMSYADLATVLMEQGDFDRAREYCQQGIELAGEIGRDDHYVYNLFVLGAVECAAGNLASARSHLARSLSLAWEQEEQTNKPVVVFYATQLLYAEYRENPDDAAPNALPDIVTVLLFLQVYPTTWQAFKDRARQFQQSIESEFGSKPFAALKKLSAKKITATALKLIPGLLA